MRDQTEKSPGWGTGALPEKTLMGVSASISTNFTEVDQARALLIRALDLLTPAAQCRRCKTALTAKVSIERGIGPVCRRREAISLQVIS